MTAGIDTLHCEKCGKLTRHAEIQGSDWKITVCEACKTLTSKGIEEGK